MKTLCFSLVVALLSISCLAGTRDPSVPDSKYLEYGQKHECVLPLLGILNDDKHSQFRASCVIIDKYHALTAAHIVYGSITQHIIYKNKAYPCAVVAIPVEFDANKMGYYDIALIKLQRPIDLDFYPELYSDDDEVGQICGLSGYGNHGTFNSGFIEYDAKKRAGSNIIDAVDGHSLTYSANKGTGTALEFLISPGDSGGGLFIDKKLAGIHSFVYSTDGKANSSWRDIGCSTRVSRFIEWIKNTKQNIKSLLENEDAIQKK